MKNKHKLLVIAVIFVSCICLSSCGKLRDKMAQYSNDKEQCILNDEDVRQFNYKAKSYTILDEVSLNEDKDKWVGVIRKLVAVDDKGKIVKQVDATDLGTNNLDNFPKDLNNDIHVFQFFDVYTNKKAEDTLTVEVNGSNYKAIPTNEINSDSKIFNFKEHSKEQNSEFQINPNNATQLIYDGVTYQVTDQVVSEVKLEDFLGIIAKDVIFDKDSKNILTKQDLDKIDWLGENKSKRQTWSYLDVYKISGINIDEGFAVKVNDQYLKAKSE